MPQGTSSARNTLGKDVRWLMGDLVTAMRTLVTQETIPGKCLLDAIILCNSTQGTNRTPFAQVVRHCGTVLTRSMTSTEALSTHE